MAEGISDKGLLLSVLSKELKREDRCSLIIVGVRLYCSISNTASYICYLLNNSDNYRVRKGTYRLLANFQLPIKVAGRMAFLNYFDNLFIFLSLEFLPSHEGKAGKPML